MRMTHTIGLDEVGTGSIAGPLVVCALTVPDLEFPWFEATAIDSKQTTSQERWHFRQRILSRRGGGSSHALYQIAIRHTETIDQVGVWESWRSACLEAVFGVRDQWSRSHNRWFDVPHSSVWIDGNTLIEGLPCDIIEQVPLLRADETNGLVAGASILAKYHLDLYWDRMAKDHPDWGFDQHYGTASPHHLKLLRERGPIPGIHRMRIVEKMLRQGGPCGNSTQP